jgi:flagellar basal-body rod modification protein FlgD
MNGAMGAMASVMENDQALRAAALVGHDALIDADSLSLAEGKGLNGEIVATSAGPMQVEVVDASGQVVRRMSVDATSAGPVPFAWDGRTEGGEAAPAGRYTVRALAGSGEDAQALDVRVAAHIDSVSIEASGLVLNLAGLGSVPLSSIRRIG